MNRRLSSLLRRRAIVWLATAACCSLCLAPLARAEVTPVPPGSTAGLQPGQQPTTPAVPVPAAPKPATNPAPSKPAAIAATLKTATDLTEAQKAQLRTYVSTNFARLLSDDNSAVDSARADLVAGMSSPAPKTPCSAPYLTAYMSAFTAELQKVVDKAALPKRVNAAIVMARVADQIHTQGDPVLLTVLYPLMQAEMKDKCDAIALWGVKAATPSIAAAPGTPTLPMLKAIVTCVKDHGLSGAITDEAYTALDGTRPEAIQATMDVYKMRVDAYANAVPPDPSVDRRAASHLTSATGMWGKMNKQQQDQVMGLIRDNLSGAATAIVKPESTPEVVEQLRTLIVDDAKAVYVVTMSNTQTGDLNGIANQLIRKSASAPAAEYADGANQLAAGLKQYYPTSGGGSVGGNGNAAVAKP